MAGDHYEFVADTFHNAAIGPGAGHRVQRPEPPPVSGTVTGSSTREVDRDGLPASRKVFVVQGRDLPANRAMFSFLRTLDLLPLDWEAIVTATGSGAPHVLDIVRQGFAEAAAVVVLVTPDDFAYLHESLHQADDRAEARAVAGQPRANVLLEAGMAFALHPERTIFVQIGRIRAFTDVDGLDFIRIDGSPGKLNNIARRLEVAGCAVDRSGTAWLDDDPFGGLDALRRGD